MPWHSAPQGSFGSRLNKARKSISSRCAACRSACIVKAESKSPEPIASYPKPKIAHDLSLSPLQNLISCSSIT
eukprot:390198-Amphidinium_carterae.1